MRFFAQFIIFLSDIVTDSKPTIVIIFVGSKRTATVSEQKHEITEGRINQ